MMRLSVVVGIVFLLDHTASLFFCELLLQARLGLQVPEERLTPHLEYDTVS
jgi:hypothetical protein